MTDTPITTGLAPLPPAEPPSSPGAVADEEMRRKPSELPPVTTGTSARYVQGLADAVSRASAADPLTVLFQGEKLAPGRPSPAGPDPAAVRRIVHAAARERAAVKIAGGGFVAEAAGFAAVACWEPGLAGGPHRADARVREERPIFAELLDKVADLVRTQLYPIANRVSGGRFWKLSLLARDPGVPYVPGAVRAVLVPFMKRFTSEQNEGGPMPVWLEAGSEQARAVYIHYGFRDVGEMDIKGVKTWGMIYTGNMDVEKGDPQTS
ncbi:hypothetical protein Hte_003639 [Hypoxylon texense]